MPQLPLLQTFGPRPNLFHIGIALCCIACIGVCMFAAAFQSSFTLNLAPPTYPESELVLKHEGGGSGGTIQTTVYRTTDHLDTVRVFMEQHMPGFQPQTTTPYGRSNEAVHAYWNEVCNTNPIAELIGNVLVSEPYPYCLTVKLYSDPAMPSATLIELEARWPSG